MVSSRAGGASRRGAAPHGLRSEGPATREGGASEGGMGRRVGPRRRAGGTAAVVGAGIVGLSVAWFLQQEGFDVTVFDRRDVAAGASAGNAGWITPAMTSPLPEPAVLRSALGSLLRTWRFLAAFAARSTTRRWLAGVASFAPISVLALPSYDVLAAGGVTGAVVEAPIVAAFDRPDQAGPLRHELQAIADNGQPLQVSELTEPELRRERPMLSGRARYGLRVE